MTMAWWERTTHKQTFSGEGSRLQLSLKSPSTCEWGCWCAQAFAMQQAHQKNNKAKHLLANKDPPAHADSPVVLGTQQSGKARGFSRPPNLFLTVHPAALARTPSAPQSLLQHTHTPASMGLWLPLQCPAVSVSALWSSTRVFTFTPAWTSPSQSPGSSHSKASITACHSTWPHKAVNTWPQTCTAADLLSRVPSLRLWGRYPQASGGLHLFKVWLSRSLAEAGKVRGIKCVLR